MTCYSTLLFRFAMAKIRKVANTQSPAIFKAPSNIVTLSTNHAKLIVVKVTVIVGFIIVVLLLLM
jgi:hypothetical protein